MKKCLQLLDSLLKALIAICTFLIFILVLVQIGGRLISSSPTWIDEVCRILFVATIFLGSALCVREKRHIRLDILASFMPDKANRVMLVVTELIVFIISILLVYSGVKLSMRNMAQILPATRLPKGVVYMIIPVSATIMSINSLRNLCEYVKDVFTHGKGGADLK